MNAAPGIVAVTLVTLATLAIGTWGLRFSRTTSDFFVASRTVRPGLNASAIGGEYLSAAQLPRRRRAAVHLRRRHAVVPGRAGPPATSSCWSWSRRPCAARAPTRCPTSPRPGWGRVRVRIGLLAARRGDRLALPAAAVPGRQRHPHLDHRRTRLAGRGDRRPRRAGQRHLRRDAQHHLRPGLPVLAEADRPADPDRRAARRLGRRRRPQPGRRGRHRRRPVVDPARRGRRARASTSPTR